MRSVCTGPSSSRASVGTTRSHYMKRLVAAMQERPSKYGSGAWYWAWSAAHGRPTSGPPHERIVSSPSDDRRMARPSDIGFRRDPQPPMPIVMPSASSATTSWWVRRRSLTARSLRELGVPLLDERLPGLVGDARQRQLEREALL